jgi:hypothetical protein
LAQLDFLRSRAPMHLPRLRNPGLTSCLSPARGPYEAHTWKAEALRATGLSLTASGVVFRGSGARPASTAFEACFRTRWPTDMTRRRWQGLTCEQHPG